MKRLNQLLLTTLFAAGCGGGVHRSDGGALGDGAAGQEDTGTLSDACRQAAATRSYIGCDYWPTVTTNPVWSIFDFAVAVANAGDETAHLSVSGPDNYHFNQDVLPGKLVKIYLPWVKDLKGEDFNNCASGTLLTTSLSHAKGAYHLLSTQPVTVYQFNALEYKGVGGVDGKDWSQCPATLKNCGYDCYSFSNDASLLLPATVLTGNYRIPSKPSESGGGFGNTPGQSAFFAVTGIQDGTTVKVKVSAKGKIMAGGVVQQTGPGDVAVFAVDAGDVVEVVCDGTPGTDLSGSLVKASAPVQVIAGAPCMHNPGSANACDHLEESVFPAETLGKSYVITVPTGPHGVAVGHTVRLIGNSDGTALTYDPPIQGAPGAINAGQVIDLGQLAMDFMITGTHEFEVASFMLGGSIVDADTPSGMQQGDPSQSQVVSTEQFRSRYVFLAPDDYDTNWVDIVQPAGTQLMLDGAPVNAKAVSVGGSGFSVVRIKLDGKAGGAHVLSGTKPIGIQVMGYGMYTSYQYPGGLDLMMIAGPPIG